MIKPYNDKVQRDSGTHGIYVKEVVDKYTHNKIKGIFTLV